MTSISPQQLRDVMMGIPSWARVLPHIDDDAPFDDCGMDSLALLELVSELQNVYGMEIPDDDVAKISTIAGTMLYLNQRMP